MKIEPRNQRKSPGPDRSVNTLACAGGEDVVLSGQDDQVRQMRRQLEALSFPPNTSRVAELRSRIARGAYSVDGGAIADAMLDDEAVQMALGFR